ncbi:MAG: crossover junction endodeoxyribonuclease RuvC [bacterium]|nr:crossover junction endodeoxyribonuclease RuvC [bacterium]
MIILGIDPGTVIIGYAFLEKRGADLTLLKADAIRILSGGDKAERLATLHKKLTALIKKCRPNMISVEKLFFSKNQKTALDVAEARGVILSTAALAKIPVSEYTPLEVKVASTGYGKADKRQVREMVRAILKLNEVTHLDDVTDAMAIAITGAHLNKNREIHN